MFSIKNGMKPLVAVLVLPLLYGCNAVDSKPQSTIAKPAPAESETRQAAAALASEPVKVSLDHMSLRDAVGLAIVRHPEIGRAGAVVSRSNAEIVVAQAAWYPTISYGAGPGSGSSGSTADVAANQLLYDFGRTPGNIDRAKAAAEQSRHEMDSTAERVAEETAAKLIEVARTQDLADAARRQVAALKHTRVLIGDRVAAGASDNSDEVLADVGIQRAQGELLKALTQRDVAMRELIEVIGVAPKGSASLGELAKTSERLATDGDVEQAPSVLAAGSAIKAAEADVKVARADGLPGIGAEVSYNGVRLGEDRFSDDDDVWVGVRLRGEISTGGLRRGKVEAADASRLAAEQARESARLSTRTAQAASKVESDGADARIANYGTMIKLARNARELYWQEYTLNKRSLNDVLNADRDVYVAESERIGAQADRIIARVRASAASGKLISSLAPKG